MFMYPITFTDVAVTAAQDLWEVVNPATAAACVHGFELSQRTEVGDAAEEMFSLAIKRGQTTSGSGGTTPTITPTSALAAAWPGTAEVNNTTKASAGTILTLWSAGWNIRAPLSVIFTPEQRLWIPPSTRWTVELVAAAPADSVTMSGTLWVEMVG